MLRSVALPLAALLLAGSNVSAAAEQTSADGPCYAARPLPALPSGTRVFVRPVLTIHTDRLNAVMTSSGDSTKEVAPPESGVVIQHKDANGSTTTIRPGVSICAYPPGTALPSYLATATPDLIMP